MERSSMEYVPHLGREVNFGLDRTNVIDVEYSTSKLVSQIFNSLTT